MVVSISFKIFFSKTTLFNEIQKQRSEIWQLIVHKNVFLCRLHYAGAPRYEIIPDIFPFPISHIFIIFCESINTLSPSKLPYTLPRKKTSFDSQTCLCETKQTTKNPPFVFALTLDGEIFLN